MAKDKKQGTTIPKHELEAIAETLYPAIVEFFESEQGQAEFKAWQQRKSKGNLAAKQQMRDNRKKATPHFVLP